MSETTETFVSTEEFARLVGVKEQTLRAAICRDGHYFGIKPVKMPNRMLRWPMSGYQKLIAES